MLTARTPVHGTAHAKSRQSPRQSRRRVPSVSCLSTNGDAYANGVVLYGPQITSESLRLWNDLLKSGQIGSLDIYLNAKDLVPVTSALLYSLGSSALTGPAYLAYENIRGAFSNTKLLADALSKVDGIHVHYLPCESSLSDALLHATCHDLGLYKTNRSKE